MSEEEKKECEEARQFWHHFYNVFIYFALGIVFIFAPSYIQTDIIWIVLPSVLLFFLFWILCGYHICRLCPNILRGPNRMMWLCIIMTALSYYISAGMGPQPGDINAGIKARLLSFAFFVPSVLFLTIKVPFFIGYCAENGDKIKEFFAAKRIWIILGGILGAIAAIAQCIQLVIQLLHL